MDTQIKSFFQIVSLALETFGGAVIVTAAAYSAWCYLAGLPRSVTDPMANDGTRVRLGKSLSFGLEFLIGADILRTLITPTMKEIAILASTIAIRTALNFFLEREIQHLLRRPPAD